MPTGIDHVVIAVRDLSEATADYAAAGFTVTQGGEHVGGATHNALVSFVDGAYFELIALKDPARATEHRWFAALEQGDGTVAYAAVADGLEAEATRLAGAGIAVHGPRDGGRLRPDGQQVSWRTLSLNGDGAPAGTVPFLIEDVTPRVLRMPDGAATEHALGRLRVDGLTVAVRDLAAARTAYATLLGEPAGGGNRFTLGSQWIELVVPEAGSDDAKRLTERGDGIVEIVLGGAADATELPAHLTHGVRIRTTV